VGSTFNSLKCVELKLKMWDRFYTRFSLRSLVLLVVITACISVYFNPDVVEGVAL